MLERPKSLFEWSLFSCVQPMCTVTMHTVQTTMEHHVGEEDVQECLLQLNCGRSPRRLRDICFGTKEVREGSEKSKSYRKTVQCSLYSYLL